MSNQELMADMYGAEPRQTQFLKLIWTEYLGKPLHQFDDTSDPVRRLHDWYGKAAWNDVYELVEFVAGHANSAFQDECNEVLTNNRAAYRFVGEKLVEVTDELQMAAINDALLEAPNPVKEHLAKALALFGNRETPDYANAIKEAICAVETQARLATNSPDATLGNAIKAFAKKGIDLHGSLQSAWGNIYGYASNVGGVRHGLKDEDDARIGESEARYMLVSCSAMVSYLIDLMNRRES